MKRAAPSILLLLSLACWSFAGCSTSKPTSSQRKAAPVRVAQVERRDVPIVVKTFGSVEANRTVAILPQIAGLITEVHFKEGDFVKQGDLLFTVDARPYRATLAAARATLARHRAEAKQAKRETERTLRLNKEGIASEQELARARADAAAAEANVRAGEAQIRSSGINVAFTRIVSPMDGKTGSLLVNAGNVVAVGDKSPLVVIRSLSPVYVRFAVPQEYLPKIREQFDSGTLTVRATARGQGAKTVEGPLTFIENTIDAATGTLSLKASFKNAALELWPGASVDVELLLGVEKQAIVAPETAVQTGQDGQYAFVVDAEQKAHVRSLAVSRVNAGLALIRTGLTPGDVVVTDGHVRLRDGSRVEVQAPAAEATTPGAPDESL